MIGHEWCGWMRGRESECETSQPPESGSKSESESKSLLPSLLPCSYRCVVYVRTVLCFCSFSCRHESYGGNAFSKDDESSFHERQISLSNPGGRREYPSHD